MKTLASANQSKLTRDDLLTLSSQTSTRSSAGRAGIATRKVLEALSRTRLPANNEVVLHLPKQIAAALKRGTLMRTGGVIRNRSGEQVLHLKDLSKLKKALKGPMLPLMALDFAQSALLDKKLKEIQEQLSSLLERVEQLHDATLLLPFEKARKLGYFRRGEQRTRTIHEVESAIDSALILCRTRLKADLRKVDDIAQTYGNKNYFGTKSKDRANAFSAGRQLLNDSQLMISLFGLRSRLYEELEDRRAAQKALDDGRLILAGSVQKLCEVFGEDSAIRRIDHLKNPLIPKQRIFRLAAQESNEILVLGRDLLLSSEFVASLPIASLKP